MKIAIVGGGLSLNDIDLNTIKPRHDLTIAINSTAWLMDCDVCFTLSLKYATLASFGAGKPYRFMFAVRRKHSGEYPCETIRVHEGGLPMHWHRMTRARCEADGGRLGLSDAKGIVHGGNSAYAAFNYAYLLGATQINLFGIDATNGERVGGKSGNHDHLPPLFESSVQQLQAKNISVVNYSLDSRIECFDKQPWLHKS